MAAVTKIRCDVAVVGGGIAGVATAAVLATQGYSTCLVRRSDAQRLQADTQRNQGQLRSGLLEINEFGDDRQRGRGLARKMFFAGRRMLQDLELPLPAESERGIVRLKNETQAELLEEDANHLRIAGVKRVDNALIQKLIPEIYDDGIYYSIPDAPFPEELVLTRLREIARAENATLIPLLTPARLLRDEYCESGVRVDFELGSDEYQIFSRATILAAGAGNLPLLDGLEIDPEMSLRQTPLLVLHELLFPDVRLFVDRVRGFSFVRHYPNGLSFPNGALVIGTPVREDNVPYTSPDLRIVTQKQRKAFASYLPPILREKMNRGRFTAGVEVMPAKHLGLQHIEPWIEWVKGVPALLKATPGRATLGMYGARQILDQLVERIGPPKKRVYSKLQLGISWEDEIRMHYDPEYTFDDSE